MGDGDGGEMSWGDGGSGRRVGDGGMGGARGWVGRREMGFIGVLGDGYFLTTDLLSNLISLLPFHH